MLLPIVLGLLVTVPVVPMGAAGGSGVPAPGAAPSPGPRAGAAASPPSWPAGPWPTYLGNPERTGANLNETTLASSNVSALRVLWSAPITGAPEDTPIVDHGMVYVSSWDGNLSAYYLSNGTRKWITSVGTSTFSSCYISTPRGPTATATIRNGTIYLMGGDPYFYALNASNGTVLWKVSEQVNSPSSGDYNWGSPLVYGPNAYLGIASACGNPGAQGMVEEINLNGTTHSVTHTFAVVPTGTVLGGVWSTPSVDPAANRVWVSTGDGSVGTTYGQSILALNATTLSLVGSWQLGINCCDYDFGAGPTLFHDANHRALVAALNKDGVVYALNRSNVTQSGWSPVWSTNLSWYGNTSQLQAAGDFDVAPAAYGANSLFVGGGFARLANGTNVSGTVAALDPLNGTPRWIAPTPGIVRAGLAYADGLVVDAADAPDNATATLQVRNATDGTGLFSLTVNGTINGAPSVADGLVLFGSGNWSLSGPGTLWALGIPLHAAASVLPVVGGAPGTVQVAATAAGGVPPYQVAWSFGDGTPSTTGARSAHTYTAPGTYSVVATITDAAGEVGTSAASVSVNDPPLSVTLFRTNPFDPTVGSAVAVEVATSGGMGPLSYSYAGLPPGCSGVNVSLFSCVPTASGPFVLRVTVADAYGAMANASLPVTVQLPPAPPLVVEAFWAEPATLAVGGSTVLTLVATGGAGPLSFRYAGLPTGCGSANRSVVFCTPRVSGSTTVLATVSDSSGATATAALELNVTPAVTPAPPPLQILALLVGPAPAWVGENATWTTIAVGGQGPLSYAYSGLPPTCPAPNASTVTCHLAAATNLSVRVEVRDPTGQSANATASLAVEPLPAPPAPAGAALGPWASLLGTAVAAGGAGAGIALAATWRRRREPAPPAPSADRPGGSGPA